MCDLIHLISASWKFPLINKLFIPFERERSLSIPISFRLPDDSICWDLEKNGVYSVWSAYRAIFGDYDSENATSSSIMLNIWNKILHANTLPRVKMFVWRACKGALSTMRGLNMSKPDKSPICSVCKAVEESELHCLRDCTIARLI